MTTEPRYGGYTLDELAMLEQQATPGPWVSFVDMPNPLYGVASVAGDNNTPIVEVCREPEHDERSADMACIAAARNALPDLLAEVRQRLGEATALWRAVEVLESAGDIDAYYEGGVWFASLMDTTATGDTPAAALIALARRVQGGE